MMVIFLPSMIKNNGVFAHFGDFNLQQIPFYAHVNDAVKSGVSWDWGTDLGSSLIGSYSFYLLGSPFFWLTVLLPASFSPYILGILIAIKTGVAAVTSYALIKRFVRSDNACMIGAFLYAMSGFQAYNIFFNHFHDVTALFPLLLLALELRVKDGKKGVFALTVGLMAVVNYYFFFGQVIFVILYFAVRCTDKSFAINVKKVISLSIESVLGLGLACFLLLPALVPVLQNPRLANILMGREMFIYSSNTRLFQIIFSFFMLNDPVMHSNLFSDLESRWSSLAGYIPVFSMVGVISFMSCKKDKWQTKLIWLCMLFAFVPILNASFNLFNAAYYARWFYMPILIMALVTAYSIDNKEVGLSKGIKITAAVMMFFLLLGLAPKMLDEMIVLFDTPNSMLWFIVQISVSIGGLLFCYLMIKRSSLNKPILPISLIVTIVGCFISTYSIYNYSLNGFDESESFTENIVVGSENITLPEYTDEYYRIETSSIIRNSQMLWGSYSNIYCFNSVVNPSIIEFYTSVGSERNVNSMPEKGLFPVRGITSARYYVNEDFSISSAMGLGIKSDEKTVKLPGFEYIENQGNYEIYENKYFVPMGFVYDKYFDTESYEKYEPEEYAALLMAAVYLTPEQIEKYGYTMSNLEETSDVDFHATEEGYFADCERAASTACYEFEVNGKGFTARTRLESDSLVFFSVPYDEGFTAYIDGKEVEIDKVQNGFSAVLCPQGDHSIEFIYETPMLKEGIVISIVSAILLIAYIILWRKFIKPEEKLPSDIDY